ncbi:MAG: hypothetical protein H0W53_09615 [Acidobacteria bacterium]|nr:hypothetical protein [Acidobacteriota bacterium]
MDLAVWRRRVSSSWLIVVVVALVGLVAVMGAAIAAQSRPAGKQTTAGREASAMAGRDVFRFETFGNEGFWTDAMRMPQGVLDSKLTPLQALEAGLLVDIDAVPVSIRDALSLELKTDRTPASAPMLHDVKTTVMLIEANAVVGMVPKDSNGDGRINLASGDKVGVTCAICHTETDKSVFAVPNAGSIGRRIDGIASVNLNVGKLLATAANSRAYYPNLQLTLGGKTIGRAPTGLTVDSSEADVDAYLSNPAFYPIGAFDETQDGIGNPVMNTPLFRQDLAAPFGSAGEFAELLDISNGSFTTNLDPTTLVTPEGRAFLKARAGALGEELATNYAKILAETGVTGFPFVKASMTGKVNVPQSLVGRRVDEKKLVDLKAYLESLPGPAAPKVDQAAASRGRTLFRTECTRCHNLDPNAAVTKRLIELQDLWPDYKPEVIAKRMPPFSPVQNSPGGYDDKMIVVDASDRDKRGHSVALLLDLGRKQVFLHDASVQGLDMLLNPARGEKAPHPFYVPDGGTRKDMIAYLLGRQTTPHRP